MCRIYHNCWGWYIRCCAHSRLGRGQQIRLKPGEVVPLGVCERERIAAQLAAIKATGTHGRLRPGPERPSRYRG